MRLAHTFPPVWDADCRALVLGSFPSVRSRGEGFYYGHPRNRFWLVLSRLCGDSIPRDNDEKRAFLLAHHIALWDVAAECDIERSDDSSIREVVPNDIAPLLAACDIRAIALNGGCAARLFRRLILPSLYFNGEILALPSTSPANAASSPDALVEAWQPLARVLNF